jgi:hypothetical protein
MVYIIGVKNTLQSKLKERTFKTKSQSYHKPKKMSRTASAKLEKGKKHADAIPTHHTMLLRGYLKKKSTKGKWQKRFFQVQKTKLNYKSTEKSSKILGSIDLKTVGAIVSDGSATGFSLQLADRLYELRVIKGSPPAEEWIQFLHARQAEFAVVSNQNGEKKRNLNPNSKEEKEQDQKQSSSSVTASSVVVVEEKVNEEVQKRSTSRNSNSFPDSLAMKAAAQRNSAAAVAVDDQDDEKAGGGATKSTRTEDEGVALGGPVQENLSATAQVEKPRRCCVVS